MTVHAVRRFGLSNGQSGVRCDDRGAFVSDVALFEKSTADGREFWAVRDPQILSDALSRCYGLPVDIRSKLNGLSVAAHALNCGEIARAQIATLNLQFPDPPEQSSGDPTAEDMAKVAGELDSANLLAKDWNADAHPRWPAGAPDSQGGEFAPKDEDFGFNSDTSSGGIEVAANGPLNTVGSEIARQRNNLADVARRYQGSKAYRQSSDENGPFGEDKCNLAVANWIAEARLPRPFVYYPDWRGAFGSTRAPDAHEWGDPRITIRGWSAPMPVSNAQPGDVIALAHDNGQGHVGIVVGPHMTASVSARTHPPGDVVINDWGFRPWPGNEELNHNEHPVVRHYTDGE